MKISTKAIVYYAGNIWLKLGAGMAQWWEHSPPTTVAWVRFQDPASHVGWLCCWFSSQAPRVFLWVLRFSSIHNNQHSKFRFDPHIWSSVCYLKCMLQVLSIYLFIYLTFLNNWRYIAYDPFVFPEDDASKETLSEKYSKILSYTEAVGFSHEVR